MEDRFPIYILIASILVLLFLFSRGFYTFDFYIHSRIAEHYKQMWFSTFDQKVGMTELTTYPPIAHQLLAILYLFLPINIGYTLLMGTSLVLFAYFLSKFSVEYLELGGKHFWLIYIILITSPGILMTVFVFGQITSMVGFAFGAMSIYYLSKFVDNEKSKYLLLSELALVLTAFSNVISFIVISIIYVILAISEHKALLNRLGDVIKLSIFPLLLLMSIYYPFIQNFMSESLIPSKEIIHFSRYPFALEINIERWYSMYGFSLLMVRLPLFLCVSPQKHTRKFITLYFIAACLLLIGLGRTTPATKVFLGFEYWLTYERFAVFSAALFWIFFVYFIPNIPKLEILYRNKKFEIVKILIILIIVASNINDLYNSHSLFLMVPVGHYDQNRAEITEYALSFLDESKGYYRYQTFGYGRAIGEIYLYSRLPTLDSDYYTGRTIDWIRDSGYSEIDQITNMTFLDTFIEHADEYSIKYILTFDEYHENYMKTSDWKLLNRANFSTKAVTIWENPDSVSEVAHVEEEFKSINYIRGVIPMFALLIFSALHINHRRFT